MKKPDIKYMQRAIELSAHAAFIAKSGGVFGAVVVKDGEIIGEGYNQVIAQNDPTWHAEMHAIREACKKIGSPHLKGCLLYTSAECCPMCLAAAYWAQIEHIFYASTTHDALHYGEFQDVAILEELCKDPQKREIGSTEFMREEALKVWKKFSESPDRVWY